MPDYIWNKLTITCSDCELRDKIKTLIFNNNDKNEPIFTMTKLLPMPEGISENPGYNEIGYHWSIVVWGTKWDVCNSRVVESGDTFIIYYDTAWDPNVHWIEVLCQYIEVACYSFIEETKNKISVTLNFCREYEEEDGKQIDWTPETGYDIKEDVQFLD